MTVVRVDYASPSSFQSTRKQSDLGLTANGRRPVRFHGKVARNVLGIRFALRALGELVWSDDTWVTDDEFGAFSFLLDPVVTVQKDRIFFEAFSQDESAYGLVILDPADFELDGDVSTGTTNVDFTSWLWAALGEMRSSRATWFSIDAGGVEVKTAGGGGRFEAKVELPDHWVRGFLQMGAAAALPGTRLELRPVDLLSAIRYLHHTKAKVSPRALRFEMDPGKDARLVLEPWEHVVPLKGAEHAYTEERRVRIWGRRRLRLIEPLLPYAESVRVYLKGRALPSFWSVTLPGATFVLGLSGWSRQRWTEGGGHDLVPGLGAPDPALIDRAHALLSEHVTLTDRRLAELLGVSLPEADRALSRLCRRGRALFDVERREVRHRELFETPIDEAKLFPPDPRMERAIELIPRVEIVDVNVQETRRVKKLKTPDGPLEREIIHRDHRVRGKVDGKSPEIVVADTGRLIFGRCDCAFFDEHLMNRGPCEHLSALLFASENARKDLPSSIQGKPFQRFVRETEATEED
jgi:hypothetical protein